MDPCAASSSLPRTTDRPPDRRTTTVNKNSQPCLKYASIMMNFSSVFYDVNMDNIYPSADAGAELQSVAFAELTHQGVTFSTNSTSSQMKRINSLLPFTLPFFLSSCFPFLHFCILLFSSFTSLFVTIIFFMSPFLAFVLSCFLFSFFLSTFYILFFFSN